MKHGRSFLLMLTAVLSTASALLGQAAAQMPNEYYKVRAVYQKQIELIEEARNRAIQEAVSGHIAALKTLERTFQESGDLKPLLAVRKERTRFEANPSAKEITPVTSPAMLGSLQKKYIENLKQAQLTAAQKVVELSAHYKRRLTALQKELTREGKIDDALAVLAQVDDLPNSPEIVDARKQIAAGGLAPTVVRRPTSAAATGIDIERLSRYFHGKVVGWNSITQEITLEYNFEDKNELVDWENAAIDPLRQRLLCDRTVVRFKSPFRSISRVESEASLYTGPGPIRLALDEQLYVELESGVDGQALIHQGNASYPLMKSHGGAQPYIKYDSILTFENNQVQWTMGSRSFPPARIQQPLRAPLQLAFGHADSKTMFGNIRIKGVLAQSVLDALP